MQCREIMASGRVQQGVVHSFLKQEAVVMPTYHAEPPWLELKSKAFSKALSPDENSGLDAFPSSEFYKYLQIRYFFSDILTRDGEEAKSPFENLCREGSRDRGTISIFYQYLNDHGTAAKLTAMQGWETETGQEHSTEDWLDMVSNMHKCTRSVAIKETVVMLHTRWYYTPVRIHRSYPSIPDTCFRGCGERGTLLHTFWRFTALRSLWQQTSVKVLQITGMLITLSYQMCILFSDLPEVSPPCQTLTHALFSHYSLGYSP